MYSAPSGYPRFSAAIETCAIQSCSRFTASSCRLETSALISATSFSAAYASEIVTETSERISRKAREVRNFIGQVKLLACSFQQENSRTKRKNCGIAILLDCADRLRSRSDAPRALRADGKRPFLSHDSWT